ncbi:15720_t:CDS:2 [Racocetra fulgida]|uniref:15720_t:CDS:1 n=1 Tax=Racocetra fulgida TaxID=60492 RepID=A0A9N8W601_9GLOM|nr:15720_t:CDS:2 [Racocetra fulgida]
MQRARKFATQIYDDFQTHNKEYYNKLDKFILESFQYLVDTKFYLVEFNNHNKENQQQYIMSFVQTIDQNLIFREAYRSLAALEHDLSQEYIIYNTKVQIDNEMQNLIPIKLVDIKTKFGADLNEQSDINDPEIIEQVISAIRKGGYRSIKDILNYIVSFLVNRNVLNPKDPCINIRISGDGRNVGRKVQHVMVTCAILDDRKNFYLPDYHYVVVLYPGSEDYNSLKNAMTLFLEELRELK